MFKMRTLNAQKAAEGEMQAARDFSIPLTKQRVLSSSVILIPDNRFYALLIGITRCQRTVGHPSPGNLQSTQVASKGLLQMPHVSSSQSFQCHDPVSWNGLARKSNSIRSRPEPLCENSLTSSISYSYFDFFLSLRPEFRPSSKFNSSHSHAVCWLWFSAESSWAAPVDCWCSERNFG